MIIPLLIPSAKRVVEKLLAVKPGEKVLIVTDFERPQSITQALLSVIEANGAEGMVFNIKPRDHGGIDPPPPVAEAMKQVDVTILQMSFATIHTRPIREAVAAGKRVCEFWGISEDMMLRGALTEDPDWVEAVTDKVADLLSKGKVFRMTTPDGTDVSANIEGRVVTTLSGGAREPGTFCSVPLGEAAVAPVEGTGEGVITGAYLVEHREIGRPREPLTLRFKDGKVVAVEGGVEAQRLQALLDSLDESARNFAEVAIGTNRKSRLDVGLREAKKAWGTAHIAIGDNQSLGGKVESPLHIDFIFRTPTVSIDDQVVVENGRLLVEP